MGIAHTFSGVVGGLLGFSVAVATTFSNTGSAFVVVELDLGSFGRRHRKEQAKEDERD